MPSRSPLASRRQGCAFVEMAREWGFSGVHTARGNVGGCAVRDGDRHSPIESRVAWTIIAAMVLPSPALRRRVGSWIQKIVVSGSLVCLVMPRPVAARHQDDELATEPSDPEMDRVWELIRTGDARADAAEYQEAITSYQAALEVLTTKPEWEAQLNMLRSLLAEAHEGAYGIHRDPVHLRKAKVLLEQYIENLESDSSELAPARNRLEAVEQKLAELEAAQPVPAEGPAVGDEPESLDDDTAVATARPPKSRPPGQPLIVAGGVMAAVGGAALFPAGYGTIRLVREQRAGKDGEQNGATQPELDSITARRDAALTLAVVSGATAVVLLAVGVTLIVKGKSKNARSGLAWGPVAPAPGGLAVRF